jgi:hypothetical protein
LLARDGEIIVLIVVLLLTMSSPESNEAPAKEPTSTEEADERELSLEDLDDVAGGAVMHDRTGEDERK